MSWNRIVYDRHRAKAINKNNVVPVLCCAGWWIWRIQYKVDHIQYVMYNKFIDHYKCFSVGLINIQLDIHISTSFVYQPNQLFVWFKMSIRQCYCRWWHNTLFFYLIRNSSNHSLSGFAKIRYRHYNNSFELHVSSMKWTSKVLYIIFADYSIIQAMLFGTYLVLLYLSLPCYINKKIEIARIG